MSNDTNAVEDPVLPIELILHVFDLAAASSRPDALSISLTCSWGRSAVARYLFTTITLDVPRLPLSPPPSAIAPLVRNLWLKCKDTHWRDAIPLFSALGHLERIALSGGCMYSLVQTIIVTTCNDGNGSSAEEDAGITQVMPHCQALYILDEWPSLPRTFAQSDVGHQFFSGITHLRLHTLFVQGRLRIQDFPNLTHVAFPFDAILLYSNIMSFLQKDSIQKLVATGSKPQSPPESRHDQLVHLFFTFIEDQKELFPDKAIHVFFCGEDPSLDDWKEEVSGGRSIWDRAVPIGEVEL